MINIGVSVKSSYDFGLYKQDLEELAEVEEKVRDPNFDYTFQDVREDLSNNAAEEVIHNRAKVIDDENQTIILGEDDFEFTKTALGETYHESQ